MLSGLLGGVKGKLVLEVKVKAWGTEELPELIVGVAWLDTGEAVGLCGAADRI